MTEFEKMISGLPYNAEVPDLRASGRPGCATGWRAWTPQRRRSGCPC